MCTANSPSSCDKTINLHDGRSLGYADFGDPDGTPMFHFHGFPGSRLKAKLLSDAAGRHGVHLIGVVRPGMGLSDFQPGRKLLDWPNDVIELALDLELETFAVEGVSGGGPYAAACAYKNS